MPKSQDINLDEQKVDYQIDPEQPLPDETEFDTSSDSVQEIAQALRDLMGKISVAVKKLENKGVDTDINPEAEDQEDVFVEVEEDDVPSESDLEEQPEQAEPSEEPSDDAEIDDKEDIFAEDYDDLYHYLRELSQKKGDKKQDKKVEEDTEPTPKDKEDLPSEGMSPEESPELASQAPEEEIPSDQPPQGTDQLVPEGDQPQPDQPPQAQGMEEQGLPSDQAMVEEAPPQELGQESLQEPMPNQPPQELGQEPQSEQQGDQANIKARLRNLIGGVLSDVKAAAPQLEQMRQQAPEIYQVIFETVQVMLNMATSLLGMPSEAEPPQEQVQEPPQESMPDQPPQESGVEEKELLQ